MEVEPGDALSFICPNPKKEVEALMSRLGLLCNRSDLLEVSVDEAAAKKRAKVPEFLHGDCTLEELFTWHLDIRSPPKKVCLDIVAFLTRYLRSI